MTITDVSTTDTPTTTEIDISSAAATETVTAKEIDGATEALVEEFVEEDALTELELANQRLVEEHNIVEIIEVPIGLNEHQSNRLSRICRDRGIDAGDFVASLLGGYLEGNVGAPTISRPNLNTSTVETQVEPVITKISGVSEKRSIVSFVNGQERR